MKCNRFLPMKHPRQTWVAFWYTLSVATAAMLPEQAVATSAEHISELGPVVATVSVEPLESLVGDPVTLTLTVTAEKDAKGDETGRNLAEITKPKTNWEMYNQVTDILSHGNLDFNSTLKHMGTLDSIFRVWQ